MLIRWPALPMNSDWAWLAEYALATFSAMPDQPWTELKSEGLCAMTPVLAWWADQERAID